MVMSSDEPIVTATSVSKRFSTPDAEVIAVDNVSLTIPVGSVTALTGPSGSGKSTLLHLIGALDVPDSGTIVSNGVDITQVGHKELSNYRRSIGFVFQRFNLIPTLNVLDNVLVPAIPTGITKDVQARAQQLLTRVGLADRGSTLATRLSGGQQQRVAIARALLLQPRLILADEPTGNLDSVNGGHIIELLLATRDQEGTTLLIATHDTAFAARCDRRLHLSDGLLSSREPSPT